MLRFIANITLGQISKTCLVAMTLYFMTQVIGSRIVIEPIFAVAQDEEFDAGVDPPVEDEDTVTTEIPTAADNPRRFRIQLSLTEPSDLKVRQGDIVQRNQVLADRAKAREQITFRKSQLDTQISRLQGNEVSRPARLPIRQLPAPDFLTEQAAIQKAQLELNQAQAELELQQRKMGVLQSLPSSEVPPAAIEHETRILEKAQANVQQKIANVSMANAMLVRAQQQRQYTEYQHQLELAKLEAQEQQSQVDADRAVQERAFQLAQLQAQATQLDQQLQTLSTVRSPYAGQISRIRWLEQSDVNLRVELTLDLSRTSQ